MYSGCGKEYALWVWRVLLGVRWKMWYEWWGGGGG